MQVYRCPQEDSMLTLLAVGEDFELLKTRAEVLRKTGANVLCSTGAAALKFIAERNFDLIVLCHSVRQRDAMQITEAVRSSGSKALVLSLVSDKQSEQHQTGGNFDAVASVEPEYLVGRTVELLDRQAKRGVQKMLQPGRMGWYPGRKRPSCWPADIEARRTLAEHFEGRKAG
jgi:CheY-like chemotaxis protein